ncbi:MAG: deoxyribodipyrimidine photo-lyase [Bacteroidota bacterium]
MNQETAAIWLRRDLRLDDNTALYHALQSGKPVIPVFIFDKHILDELPQADARVEFIHKQIERLQEELAAVGSSMVVRYGVPEEIWPELIENFHIKQLYINQDYEPYAKFRDAMMSELVGEKGGSTHFFKDQVIFEKEEILSNSDKPYTVFTPYSRKWKAALSQERVSSLPSESLLENFFKSPALPIPSLVEMGFNPSGIPFPQSVFDRDIIKIYDEKRNFPAQKGTTRLGIHLRFGTISIRKLARTAIELNETYLNELIWREFYMQILWNFPHVAIGPFKPQYAGIPWNEDEEMFQKWCEGKTGFPLVDAGMRELNATGFMHNRVRMLTASFLIKDLLINWQWGERYFAEKLLDFELSSNNGGWQWAASCGTDAAPYFRIFNPESQMKKFDPGLHYVRKWVPEFGTPLYPNPIVNHKEARERTLSVFKEVLNSK